MAVIVVQETPRLGLVTEDTARSLAPALKGQPGGSTMDRAAASSEAKPNAEARFLIFGFGLIVLGWLLGYWITTVVTPAPFTPVEGISVFAVMYIFAQGLERLMDPILSLYGGKKEALKARDEASAEANKAHAASNLVKLANAEEEVTQERANLAILAWGLASFLAMLGSGFLGMYLLRAVGLSSAPAWLDIPLTGLAIGGGTKPLHDLVKSVEKSKEEKEDKQSTKTLGGTGG